MWIIIMLIHCAIFSANCYIVLLFPDEEKNITTIYEKLCFNILWHKKTVSSRIYNILIEIHSFQ